MEIPSSSRVDSLVFQVFDLDHKTAGINITEVYVNRCSDIKNRAAVGYVPYVWRAAERKDKQSSIGAQITYGAANNDFVTMVEPLPLEQPGCYVAFAYARGPSADGRIDPAGGIGFRVKTDGTVSQMKREELNDLFSTERP